MTHRSEPTLLVLHAVRLLGFASSTAIADRAGVAVGAAAERLRAWEGLDWVQHVTFADLDGWSLTDAGRIENERQLATERALADPQHRIASVYRGFLPLNARLLRAVTDWQIAGTADDAFASNDHSDHDRDDRILAELAELGTALSPLAARLTKVLARFDGYAGRFENALRKARDGDGAWVDRTDVDSCHRVWFQLHEDLIATLGIDRGAEIAGGAH